MCLLAAIDGVPGDPAEVKFIKAQALTMRAHGYIRLMQVYVILVTKTVITAMRFARYCAQHRGQTPRLL